MNLKACFNFNFFKENIRKSKGLLAFLLGVIPIINIIYLIIFMIELAFCCGGFNGMPRRQIDTIQTIQDKLESRNDPILIKPLIIMAVPLIIVFLINYLY